MMYLVKIIPPPLISLGECRGTEFCHVVVWKEMTMKGMDRVRM